MLNRLRILKLKEINQYLIARFIFRYYVGGVPDPFTGFFTKGDEIHFFMRRHNHFHIPSVKTDLAKSGIRYQGTVTWNLLLEHAINPIYKTCKKYYCLAHTLTQVFPLGDIHNLTTTVTMLVYDWCHAISSKSKCQTQTFPACYSNKPQLFFSLGSHNL